MTLTEPAATWPNQWEGPGMNDTALLDGEDLDAAIEHARAALAALLRAAALNGAAFDGAAGPPKHAGEGSPLVAEARALLASLLDHRIDLAAQRMGAHQAAVV